MIPVVSNDVAVSQSLNLTHILEKRRYVPPGMLCRWGEVWAARNCFGELLDQVWVDFCWDVVGGRLNERFRKCPDDAIIIISTAPHYPQITIRIRVVTGLRMIRTNIKLGLFILISNIFLAQSCVVNHTFRDNRGVYSGLFPVFRDVAL